MAEQATRGGAAFTNRQSFGLALGLTLFNLAIAALFMGFHVAIDGYLGGIPESSVGAGAAMTLAALWVIGNVVLLLGFIDAVRPPPRHDLDSGFPGA